MPTNREKINLPFDIRKMYCQSVDIHQQVVHYEMGIISEKDFIDEVRKIVKKYDMKATNNPSKRPNTSSSLECFTKKEKK